MILEVYDKTTLSEERVVRCQYPVDVIVSIQHYTYREMLKMEGFFPSDYKRTEVFMQLAIRNEDGTCEYATFPTSRWDIEFKNDSEATDICRSVYGLT